MRCNSDWSSLPPLVIVLLLLLLLLLGYLSSVHLLATDPRCSPYPSFGEGRCGRKKQALGHLSALVEADKGNREAHRELGILLLQVRVWR